MAWNSTVLLYREMLRESRHFDSYIYRTYALRRIKDAFRANRGVTDYEKKELLLKEAKTDLDIIKRQVVLNQMYKDPKLVVEQQKQL
jgi:hypothetical protein